MTNTFRELYRDGQVTNQAVANTVMGILDRLDKAEGEYRYLDNLYDKLSQRLDALEGKQPPTIDQTCPVCGGPVTIEGDGSTHWYRPRTAPEPMGMPVSRAEALDISKATLERAERERTEPTSGDVGLVNILVDFGQHIITLREAVAKIKAAKLTPAPEPTSETHIGGLYVRTFKGNHIQATKLEVQLEAVRLGLLDTPRRKVEKAVLHALLLDTDDEGEECECSAETMADMIKTHRNTLEMHGYIGWDMVEVMMRVAKVLRKNIAVLEAAQAEGNGERQDDKS
jgi:hypothetical protein